jgi:hypothetical protein
MNGKLWSNFTGNFNELTAIFHGSGEIAARLWQEALQ